MDHDTESHVERIFQAAGPGKKIVFLSGNFNIIHPGHLRIINFAASCGDFLVVGVLSDDNGHALIPEQMRREGVAAIGVVNYSFVLDEPPESFIARLRPSVVIKGREHSRHHNPEQAVVDSYGGKLLFGSGDVRFSSLDLLRRDLHDANLAAIRLPRDFPKRHRFSTTDLISVIERFASLKVVVVGDLIIDEYITCDPLGMSREDPTLVVMPLMSERFVGGAGIVAAHARGLGAEVSYFGVAARDEAGEFAARTLRDYGVHVVALYDESRPTTLKQRYRAGDKTLLRVSHLRQHDISADLIAEMVDRIRPALDQADLMVFSDFNYGCLPQALVEQLAALCRERGVRMVADSQASSQVSDISRFRDMLLITPTEHEARLAVRDSQSGLVVLSDSLQKKANASNLMVTLASEGCLIHVPDGTGSYVTDMLPAFNHAPRDVSGAGDCLLMCASMALVAGADIWQAAFLGALGAACQVSRIGNTPLSARELLSELAP